MKVIICENPTVLGQQAAQEASTLINEAILKQGAARILVSTGASQFAILEALIKEEVDWSRVTMFHLDEYINMPETHQASFVKYLKERFTSKVRLGRAHFIDGMRNPSETIAELTCLIREAPIDLGLIGIGENAHIAFNDPPADFETTEAYKVVALNGDCRNQQMHEGWFPALTDVPERAISVTVHEILQCRHIICAVPFKVKAQAIYSTIHAPEVTSEVPSTALRNHENVTLYLDSESASMLSNH